MPLAIDSGDPAPSIEVRDTAAVASDSDARSVPWGNSLFALFDQGLVSCGNFLTSVLLAGSLATRDYGIYTVLLDAILFFNSLQAALLIYPLTVRCPGMDKDKVRTFAGTCVILTLVMAIPLGLLMFAYGSYVGAANIAIWAVLGQTFWQCQETLRRTMFARGTYSRALPGDLISYLGQAMIIGLLVWGSKISVSYAFMAITFTSLVAAIIQASQLRIRIKGFAHAAKMSMNFWNSGRWVLVSNLTTLISGPCCSYALLASHGRDANGQFGAISNLMRPSNPLLIALSTLIVPAVALVAAQSGQKNLKAAKRIMWKFTFQGLALLMPYWLVLLIIPNQAIAFLYPHKPDYQHLGFELRLFVASYMMTMVNVVVAAMLNGFNRSRRALAAQLVGSVASAAVTIPLTIHWGVRGLLLGTLISNAVIAISLVYLMMRLQRHLAGETSELIAT